MVQNKLLLCCCQPLSRVRGPISLIKCKPDSSNTPPWKQLQPDPWGSIKRHSVETWKKAPWKWIIASTPPHPDPSIPCARDHKKEHGGGVEVIKHTLTLCSLSFSSDARFWWCCFLYAKKKIKNAKEEKSDFRMLFFICHASLRNKEFLFLSVCCLLNNLKAW